MSGLRYAVLGAGAMGSVFGARLHLAGFQVELLNRRPDHSRAIRQKGLLANIDGVSHRLDIAAGMVDDARVADVIILFTKSYQIETALENLPKSLQSAHVMALQNGLGNGDRVAAIVGEDKAIHGVTMMPGEYIQHGEVASSDAAETWFYHVSGQSSGIVDRIGKEFNQAGIRSTVTADINRFIWQKTCFNIAMNALCGLTQGSPGLLHQYPDGQALAHELADEAIAVATASSVTVDADKVHNLIDFACANHTWHRPSMLQDLTLGRLTEIDSLNGYLVNKARSLNIDIPLNRTLTRLIKLRESSATFWTNQPATTQH